MSESWMSSDQNNKTIVLLLDRVDWIDVILSACLNDCEWCWGEQTDNETKTWRPSCHNNSISIWNSELSALFFLSQLFFHWFFSFSSAHRFIPITFTVFRSRNKWTVHQTLPQNLSLQLKWWNIYSNNYNTLQKVVALTRELKHIKYQWL